MRKFSRSVFVLLVLSLFSGVWMAAWCVYPGLSTWALFVPMALSSIGNGLSQPTAMAAGLSVYPRIAGTASGFIGFLQMSISALGTLAVGALPHDGPLAMAGVVVATQIVACGLGVVAVRLPIDAELSLTTPLVRPRRPAVAFDRGTPFATNSSVCGSWRGFSDDQLDRRDP